MHTHVGSHDVCRVRNSKPAAEETTKGGETTTQTSKDEEGKPDFENKELNIAVFEGGFGRAYWEEVISRFEQEYQGVKVNMTSNPKIMDIIKPQIVAGNPPDFIYAPMTDNTGTVQTMIKEKALLELNDVFDSTLAGESAPLKDKMVDGILNYAAPHSDGKSFIYHPTFGILNSFLEAAGLNSWIHAWLGEKSTVLWALIFPMVWQAIGYYMIIYIAAIQGIPNDIYEAAVIDGASEWKQFTHMTVPLIWGILRITIIFFFIQVFNQSFVYIQVMTDGGPDGSSEILMTYMYKQAFQNGNFGYAMAVGVFMLFISLTLSFISDRLMGRDAVEY